MPFSSYSGRKVEIILTATVVLVGAGPLLWLWGFNTPTSKGVSNGSLTTSGPSSLAAQTEEPQTAAGDADAGQHSLRSLSHLFQTNPTKPSQTTINVPPPVIPQPMSPEEAQMFPRQVAPQAFFPDVPTDHWINPILMDLADRKLIKGFPDGTFGPGQPMTRAQFATQIASVFELSQQAEASAYQDVPPDHWAYENIQNAVRMGFLKGYPQNQFLPDEAVTRLQVIIALANGLNLNSSSGTYPVLRRYKDRQDIPAWGQRSIVAATEANIVVNYPDVNYLQPYALASRAEVIAMLHRALVYTGDVEDIPSPYLVVPHLMPH